MDTPMRHGWLGHIIIFVASYFWLVSLPPAEAQLSRLPSVSFSGRDYIRVSDLARGCGMNISTQGLVITLRSQSAVLGLEIDSREATVNGLRIWLNAPPTTVRGVSLIGRIDALKVIEPVLFPPRSVGASAFRAILIDPGHGGSDQGTQSASGILEKTVALDVSKRLQNILSSQGLVAVLTRSSDATLPLDRRVSRSKELRADLFVSVHFNSEGRGRSVRGIETYCLTPSGAASTASTRALAPYLPGNRYDPSNMLLAFHVHRTLLVASGAPDRGVRRARFYVLQYAECRSILVE